MNASSPVYYLPVFCGIDYCSLRSQQHASQSMSRDFGIGNLSVLLFIFILYFFPRLIIKFLFLKVIDSVFVCNLADYFTWISSCDRIIRDIFGYYTSCTDHYITSNGNTRKNHCISADPYIISHCYRNSVFIS